MLVLVLPCAQRFAGTFALFAAIRAPGIETRRGLRNPPEGDTTLIDLALGLAKEVICLS